MNVLLKKNSIMSIFKKKESSDVGSHIKESNHVETKYQCPMKCEGEKTYDEPGRCPVCKMYLKPVNE